MAVVSAMAVSQTVESQTVSVSGSVSVSVPVSVSVVSIGLGLSLSLPLVQSGHLLEGVSAGVELADFVSGSEVAKTVQVSVSVGISAPLAEVVSTASVACGLNS